MIPANINGNQSRETVPLDCYLEVDDELELGAALLLDNGCDGQVLHALQQGGHHRGAGGGDQSAPAHLENLSGKLSGKEKKRKNWLRKSLL